MAQGDIVSDPDLLNQLNAPAPAPAGTSPIVRPNIFGALTVTQPPSTADVAAAREYLGEDPTQASVLKLTLAGAKHAWDRGALGMKSLFTDLTPEDVNLLGQGESTVRVGGTPAQVGEIAGTTALYAPVGGGLATAGVKMGLGEAGTLPFLGRTALQAGGGAAVGAMETPEARGRAAFLGALGGAGGETVGSAIGRFVGGAVPASEEARTLMQEGVQPTIGQGVDPSTGMGWWLKPLEEKLTSLPLVGDLIQSARARSIRDFNQAALDRAMPPDVTGFVAGKPGATIVQQTAPDIGHKGIDAIYQEFDKQYGAALAGINAPFDKAIGKDIFTININNPLLSADQNAAVQKWVNTQLAGRLSKTNTMSGNDIKDFESLAGSKARDYYKSGDLADQPMGQAFDAIHDALVNWRNRYASDTQKAALAQIDNSYANFVRVANAADRAGREAGVFTPGQLSQSVRSLSSGTEFARGQAFMQDLSTPAQILPSRLPESGTAARAFIPAATALASGAGGALVNPWLALPLASPLFYPRFANRFLLGGYDWQQQLADALRRQPYAASAGVGTAMTRTEQP